MGHYFDEMVSDAYYERQEKMYKKELKDFYDAFNAVLKASKSRSRKLKENAMYKFKEVLKKEYSIGLY